MGKLRVGRRNVDVGCPYLAEVIALPVHVEIGMEIWKNRVSRINRHKPCLVVPVLGLRRVASAAGRSAHDG